MRNAFQYISLWLSPICDFNWLDIVLLNIYHLYISDVLYTDVDYFTFVVPKMYQWQVRNDFNKDVYISMRYNLTNCGLVKSYGDFI